MKRGSLSASEQLTNSEIERLKQRKREISASAQAAFADRPKKAVPEKAH
jgi:hypothetical protein